jgi:Uri superfamily endonuclease
MNQGTYQIMLHVEKPLQLQVGSLGVRRFPQGRYVYVGRASKGLAQRMQRHLKKDKLRHWHIDYLTSHPQVTVEEVRIVSSDPNRECATIKNLLTNEGYQVPVVGFGSSDCRSGCPAHLLQQRV